MSVADQIYEIVKTLSEEQQAEVLAFAQFIKQKYEKEKKDEMKDVLGENL